MKKFIKISSIALVSFFALIYLAFLITPFVFNKFYGLAQYKKDVQKLVYDNSKLYLDYSKIDIYTTPFLSIGISISDPKININSNSNLFSATKIKGGIFIPELIITALKTGKNYYFDKAIVVEGAIRTSKCYLENPKITLDIENSEQYKIVKLIQDLINENNKKPKIEKESEFEINIDNLKYILSSLLITNYEIKVNDLKSNHSLKLYGDELLLKYNGKKNIARVKTLLKLNSDEKENIVANIDFKTKTPEIKPTKQEELDPDEKIEFPFINIVKIYQTYDLKFNLDTNLAVYNLEDLDLNGYFNVDGLSLKLSDVLLPESYLHSEFKNKKVDFDSNIYATKEEKLALLGKVKLGKHPHLKTEISSDEIHFENLIKVLKGLLDSLNFKNNIDKIKTTGYLKADAKIDTDFKKLISSGNILVKDGSFIDPNTNIGIRNLKANMTFENNSMNIKDASATINNSNLKLIGTIDETSYADIKLTIENLGVSPLYNAFAPRELKKQVLLNSLNLTTYLNLKGILNELNISLNTKLKDLALSDYKKTTFVSNKLTEISLNLNKKEIIGLIKNSNLKLNIPQMHSSATIDNLLVNLNSSEIKINPFIANYNKTSKITASGTIKNYQKKPETDLFINGVIPTKDIKQTLGNEISYYVPSKGNILFKSTIKGNNKEQNILAQIYSDNNNYISPIILKTLKGAPSLLNARISIKGNKIKIKESGLFKKAQNGFSSDLEANLVNAKKLVDFTTIIDNNHINLLRVDILNDLAGQIAIFSKSSFVLGGKITLTGAFDDIFYSGNLKLKNLNIPEILLKINEANLNLLIKTLNLDIKNIDLNSSKIDVGFKTSLKPEKILKLNNLYILSDKIDVDKITLVSSKAMNYVPKTTSTSSNKSSSQADIGLNVNGKFNIKEIKTGNIIIDNSKGNLEIKKNNLYINNLICKAFKGDVLGSIKINLLNMLVNAKLKGQNLDTNDLMVNAANMKDTLSGVLGFDMDISIDGAATNYESQMKSLKGNLNFKMTQGQYGPFAKLENFFLAQNIRENPVFKNTIGVILTPITTIDSSHYEVLEGKLLFNNGVVKMNPITSQGDILCILIKGNMNLLTNQINSFVRVRMASSISDMLGPLAMANPVNLIKNTPGLNIVTAKLFTFFTTVVEEREYKEIPDFSSAHSDKNATKFQIVLEGDVAKPLKLVKSFKWLVLQKDLDSAKEFSDNYIKQQEELAKQELIKRLQKEYEDNNKVKVGLEKILKMDTTAPAVKELLQQEAQKKTQEVVEKTINQVNTKIQEKKTDVTDKIQSEIENKLNSTLNSIGNSITNKIEKTNTLNSETKK